MILESYVDLRGMIKSAWLYMPIVKISARGQILIPQKIREKMDLHKGRRLFLEFSERDKIIILRPIDNAGHSLLGILKGTNALELLEAEHRSDLERDERRSQ